MIFIQKIDNKNKNSAANIKQSKTEHFIDKTALNKNISLVVCSNLDG